MTSSNLDSRPLPNSWPSCLREVTETARGVRDNPILKTIVEGMLIEKCAGSDCGFTEHVAVEYVRRRLGDEGVTQYREADYASRAEELTALVEGPAGWRASPLTVGLALTHDLGQAYAPAPHLRLISDAVTDAFNGRGPRNVLVSLPSRYGKSELAGRHALEFFFANYPGLPAIYVSATDDLSTTMGRMVKNDLALHESKFGFALAEDSAAAGRFSTTIEGGQLIATGIFGQVLGRGAALMVIDDLFKSSEQGNSSHYRDQVWDLWVTALQTRLQSGAVLVAIGTRFHTEDLLGRLISGWGDAAPLECRYIRLPALAESDDDPVGRRTGEALPLGPVQVPGFGYTRAELEQRRAQSGADVWATNYQQQPVDETKANKAYRFSEDDHVRETALDPAYEMRVGVDFNVSPLSVVIAQIKEVVTDPLRRILTNERIYFVEVHSESRSCGDQALIEDGARVEGHRPRTADSNGTRRAHPKLRPQPRDRTGVSRSLPRAP